MPLDGKTLRSRPEPGQPHRRPISFSASCLFSKTLNVVRDVVDVAADHLAVLFARAAREHPERHCLVSGSRRMTSAQVEREAVALAEALAGLGVQPGDRLAVDLPNWPEWVVTLLAAAYRSVVLVPLDPSLTAHELKYQLRQDRKSTRLNSSHSQISYAVFCLKKKKRSPTALPISPPARDTSADSRDYPMPPYA